MSIWFRKIGGLDAEMMRRIAEETGVAWSVKKIAYRGHGIGYVDGDSSDAQALQDAAESALGYRPVLIDPPSEPDTE